MDIQKVTLIAQASLVALPIIVHVIDAFFPGAATSKWLRWATVLGNDVVGLLKGDTDAKTP